MAIKTLKTNTVCDICISIILFAFRDPSSDIFHSRIFQSTTTSASLVVLTHTVFPLIEAVSNRRSSRGSDTIVLIEAGGFY